MSMPASFHRRSTDASNLEASIAKWQQSVLSALAKTQLQVIAEAIDKDVTGASRVRSGETRITINEALALISALGFKAVSADAVCVKPEMYQAVATLAQSAMADSLMAHRLIFEGDA